MTGIHHAGLVFGFLLFFWRGEASVLPLFNSNSTSDLSFPGKGTDRAVPKDSGLGQAAKGTLFRLPLVGYVFVNPFLWTSTYLESESKSGHVEEVSLVIARSNQGGRLATLSVH